MIGIMIVEMLMTMTMPRPNFHMRQPSLFGLTSQTCEKFACQVGITASQTNESWPKTTYGHTHTETRTPPARLWHIASPKSQLLRVELVPLPVSCGFGQTDKTWPPQLSTMSAAHPPPPPPTTTNRPTCSS